MLLADTSGVASGGEQRGVVGLLTSLCRELVASPGGDGCLASRVIGDVLIGVADYAPDGRTLQLGHGYLVSAYPETKLVLESRQPRCLSLADDDVDPGEAAILRSRRPRSRASRACSKSSSPARRVVDERRHEIAREIGASII